MLIDFHEIKEMTIENMNNGEGKITAKIYKNEQGKIIPCTLHKGNSIGLHKHDTSNDINYIISVHGKTICDGQEEILKTGTCHICKKSEHSIINTGNENLVIITIVAER